MSLPREQTDGLMHFAWHLAHPLATPEFDLELSVKEREKMAQGL
jgi:hypothetical protein